MADIDPNVVSVCIAILGLAAGSFLNVLILRTHQETSPWLGRSKCPQCGHQLSWAETIPVISFVWLRGRCRHCRTALSWQYPLVELVTALGFVVVAAIFGITWTMLAGWLVIMMVVAIAVYDGRWSMLPDSFSLTLAIAGLTVAWLSHIPVPEIIIGGIVGAGFFGAQYVMSRGRWIGSGDILLGGALGFWLGWRMLLLALLLAYFVGAIIASILVLVRRGKPQSQIAFGPYLVAGACIAWLWGQSIVDWYFAHAVFR